MLVCGALDPVSPHRRGSSAASETGAQARVPSRVRLKEVSWWRSMRIIFLAHRWSDSVGSSGSSPVGTNEGWYYHRQRQNVSRTTLSIPGEEGTCGYLVMDPPAVRKGLKARRKSITDGSYPEVGLTEERLGQLTDNIGRSIGFPKRRLHMFHDNSRQLGQHALYKSSDGTREWLSESQTTGGNHCELTLFQDSIEFRPTWIPGVLVEMVCIIVRCWKWLLQGKPTGSGSGIWCYVIPNPTVLRG